MTHAPEIQDIAALSLVELIGRASALAAAGDGAGATDTYKRWIAANGAHPQRHVALFNCSVLQNQLGDAGGAIEALKQAIALNPDFIPAYINLGGQIERAGQPSAAIELWRTAANRPVALTGNTVTYVTTALKQMARVLGDHQQLEAAEGALKQCLEINPQQSDVIEQYVAMRLAQCKWPVIAPAEGLDSKRLIEGIHPLSMSVYTDDPLLQLASAERYSRSFDACPSEGVDRRAAEIDLKGRRLRIGYVSSDMRDHATGNLMVEAFELHDRDEFEIFAYYCGPESKSALAQRFRDAAEHWRDIRPLGDDAAAETIAKDGVDILVDVNGHTRDSRTGVFARRPAPIQANWLGYPGTMGTPYHHYIIADEWIIPPEAEIYYSERVVRLPCYQPNDRKRIVAAECPPRAAFGLPGKVFVFCCFNGTHKINRFTFERWMEILARVPESVLWLLEPPAETKARLRALAEARGIAGERLVFAPKLQHADHLARYAHADLFLDTVPYNAHTTASDALWMGVPVLTLSGRSFASRVGGSLVRSAGLPELVTTRSEEYMARAIELASERRELETLRARLEGVRNTCTLFDTNLFARSLEGLYRTMCREYQKGLLPKPDLTNLDTYLAAGVGHDHEEREVLGVEDYSGLYVEKLARLHRARPMAPDSRLWTGEEIARAEKGLAR